MAPSGSEPIARFGSETCEGAPPPPNPSFFPLRSGLDRGRTIAKGPGHDILGAMARHVWALLALATLAGTPACTADTDEEVEDSDAAATASAGAAGIKPGSLEEEGLLLLVNDRTVTADTLRRRAHLTSSVARAIVAYRTSPQGAPRWFASAAEVDALANTGKVTFTNLLADARANGYVEKSGFDFPAPRLTVPENLGRPPTSNDVTVEAGHDGISPDEAYVVSRGRATHVVAAENERFLKQTFVETHKAFTIALNNLFVASSPTRAFFAGLGADAITVVGNLSAVDPVSVLVEKGGQTTMYRKGASSTYVPSTGPRYAVVMRARVQLEPVGVRVFYPAWSAPQLASPPPPPSP